MLLRVPGVDPDITDSAGLTPLHEAVISSGQQLLAVQALLQADTPQCNRSPGTAGAPGLSKQMTPLHLAVASPQCRNRRLAVQLLVAAGADVSARAQALSDMLISGRQARALVGGQTPLHFGALVAAAGTDGIDELLQLAADGKAQTAGGKCSAAVLMGMVNDDKLTALHMAAAAGNVPVVTRLLEQPGCNPGAPGLAGRTPLHCAVLSSAAAANFLLEHPAIGTAEANARHDGGFTPLHFAASHARSNPEARASLGALLASDKVDSSLTATEQGCDVPYTWEQFLKRGLTAYTTPAFSSGSVSSALSWLGVALLGKLQSGAGQLLFSIYLLTVLSGFGDDMSTALFWVSWLLLAVDACLVYAVRPLAEELERKAMHLGLSGRVWCLAHLETSYIMYES